MSIFSWGEGGHWQRWGVGGVVVMQPLMSLLPLILSWNEQDTRRLGGCLHQNWFQGFLGRTFFDFWFYSLLWTTICFRFAWLFELCSCFGQLCSWGRGASPKDIFVGTSTTATPYRRLALVLNRNKLVTQPKIPGSWAGIIIVIMKFQPTNWGHAIHFKVNKPFRSIFLQKTKT